jgi:uncharacterized RDD family membrane protein YckC
VVLGALAADPGRATPPARGKGPAPIRDVPALRKRDKPQPAWKDEVRERMRQRKLKGKPEAELPLFRDAAPEADAASPEAALSAPAGPQPELLALAPELQDTPLADAASEFLPPESPVLVSEAVVEAEPAREVRIDLAPAPTPALRLRRFDAPPPSQPEPVTSVVWHETAEPRGEEPADEWQAGDDAPLEALPPVERPAQFGERLQAGGIDAAILGGLYAVVVYFASRAAHTSVEALVPAWPWLAGYLAFLGLAYAAWFTGMHGQTPGKMLLGLHVKTHAGACPNWGAAALRAAAGALGIALVGLGMLPLFFDPARRALHDRLLRTRVVRV